MVELSKQIGDYYTGTATSDGAAGGTTIVDTGLKAKENDWITDVAYDRVTSGTYDEEERSISSLANTTGTLTTLAHGGQIVSAVTYEVHRLWTASEKRTALVYAARHGFPYIHKKRRYTAFRAGDWLKNAGNFYKWTLATGPDDWTRTDVTAAKNTTAPYYLYGDRSLKLSTAAGSLKQTNTNNALLNQLAGNAVRFQARGWCDTASCLRLKVYDGTTSTYSEYHDGDSSWDDVNRNLLKVEVTLAAEPTEVTFEIDHDLDAGTSYIEDVRVISGTQEKIYIGYLNIRENEPSAVSQTSQSSIHNDRWDGFHNFWTDNDKYLHLPTTMMDWFLKIEGEDYLDFLDTSGDSGTDWTDTISIDSPQTDILVAEAIIYLFRQAILPQASPGSSQDFTTGLAYWMNELKNAQVKFGMSLPPVTKRWSI